jgi:cytochrome P450
VAATPEHSAQNYIAMCEYMGGLLKPANAISLGTPAVVRTAVEEILRRLSIVHTGSPRIATEDIVTAGQSVPAGDIVMASLLSADRDEKVFPDADTFDVIRTPGAHLAFGHGIHQCLGAELVRMELSASRFAGALTCIRAFERLAAPPETFT